MKKDGMSKEMIKQYLETFFHEQIGPLAEFLKKTFPGLKVDQTWEKAVVWMVPAAEAWIRQRYGKTIETSEIKKYLFELGTDLVRELISEMKKDTAAPSIPAPVPSSTTGGVPMKPILDVWTDGSCIYSERCPKRHHSIEISTNKKQKDKDGVEHEKMKYDTRSGFYQIDFEAYVLSGLKPPDAPEPGCACRKLLAADRIEFDKQQAEKDRLEGEQAKAKANVPKPMKEPLFTRDEKRAAARRAVEVAGSAVGAVRSAVGSVGSTVGGIIKAAGDGEVFNFEQKNKTELWRQKLARAKEEAASRK